MIILLFIVEMKDPYEGIGKKSSSAEAKENIRRVLKLEYMSSKDEGEDENGDPIFLVPCLAWQRPEFARVKRILDEEWLSIQTSRNHWVTIKGVISALS